MDALQTMLTRRSVAKLRPEPVPRALIEQILESAVWAPNHKRTEPWRFFVFSGDSRTRLAEAFIENYRRDHPFATPEEMAGPGQKSANRVLQAPVTIVVTAEAGRNEVESIENYAASVCATEHILLAAHALELGAYWRTGDSAYTAPHNAIKELLELPDSVRLVAFIPLGYPEPSDKERQRVPFTEKTTWFD